MHVDIGRYDGTNTPNTSARFLLRGAVCVELVELLALCRCRERLGGVLGVELSRAAGF